jgi:organic hydroperoxide reductase OsmC/OhrA
MPLLSADETAVHARMTDWWTCSCPVPKAMGGPGKPGATTPEDLFAAGYAACFGSACEFMGA